MRQTAKAFTTGKVLIFQNKDLLFFFTFNFYLKFVSAFPECI